MSDKYFDECSITQPLTNKGRRTKLERGLLNISQKYSRQADKVTVQLESLEIVPQFSENDFYRHTSKKDIDSLV